MFKNKSKSCHPGVNISCGLKISVKRRCRSSLFAWKRLLDFCPQLIFEIYLNLLLHRCEEILSPVLLSQLHPATLPKIFPKGLVTVDQFVYETDPEKITEANPHGVGQSFGKVTDPYGRQLQCLFLDDDEDDAPNEPEAIQKANCRAAPPVGTRFFIDGTEIELIGYSSKGAHLSQALPRKKKRAAAKKKRKAASPAKGCMRAP